jgi:hypothetical protein
MSSVIIKHTVDGAILVLTAYPRMFDLYSNVFENKWFRKEIYLNLKLFLARLHGILLRAVSLGSTHSLTSELQSEKFNGLSEDIMLNIVYLFYNV